MLGEKIALGVAAVWDKRKGLDDIVKLSQLTDAQIIVVGISEEQKKTLPSEIIAHTRTNNVEELRQLYAVADVFINPTYEDNFPTTIIEALACGTPVVTYDTGGSPEVAGTIAGAVVDVGSIVGLNATIESTFFQQEACRERGQQFVVAKMTERYLLLY